MNNCKSLKNWYGKKKWFMLVSWLLMITLLGVSVSYAEAKNKEKQEETVDNTKKDVSLSAVSAVLMEQNTGEVLYEKEGMKQLPLASVTKVMTLLLIFDAIENKQCSLEDMVSVSEHAASMGGSQVFLEPGEQQSVETLIKCICVASANDACVTMAEFLSGSEDAFVEQMNQRAKGLGMENTHFVNCCGLDVENHYSCAMDIAVMSRELKLKHPEVTKYCTIWMENITHVTKKGETEFGLSNTNKMIKHYQGATGLKTGSTSKAKFCLSATATRNGIDLIAVVMACPDGKQRVKDASALLDYGFGSCALYQNKNVLGKKDRVAIKKGVKPDVALLKPEPFKGLLKVGETSDQVKKTICLAKDLKAPIKKGAKLGEIIYRINDRELGKVTLYSKESVRKMTMSDCYKTLWLKYLKVKNVSS